MELFLSRVINGYLIKPLGTKQIRIYYPTPEIEYGSHLIYNEIISQNYEYRDREFISILGRNWNGEKESRYNELREELDNQKANLYHSFHKPSQADTIRDKIAELKLELIELQQAKSRYDSYSIEGVAERARLTFFIEHSTFLDGKIYDWSDWSVDRAIEYWVVNLIDEPTIRELARCDMWLSMFSSAKFFDNFPFHGRPCDMNVDQKRLLNWSIIYYNVSQGNDNVTQEIMSDDDAFDGYLISKRKEKRSTKGVDSLVKSKKVKNSEEIYIMAQIPEDIKEVYSFNDSNSQAVIQERFRQIQETGGIKHGKLDDIVLRAKIELNRANAQRNNRRR